MAAREEQMRIRWAVALVLCATAAAAAERDDLFGARGRILVSGAFSLTNISSSVSGSSSVTTIVISPGLQIFVAPEVALGLQLELAHLSDGGSATVFSFLPSIGYCVELGHHTCLLPQFQVGVQINDFPGVNQTAFEVGGQVPLLFRPAPGFFFGFGPSLLADVSRSNSAGKLLTFGLQSILGGVFGAPSLPGRPELSGRPGKTI
jgi:hypothetical protein